MSFTMYGTDEVFAALLGLRSNSYRMYDPSEHRSYYDHDCETYERAVNDAAREYERLLKHCEKQRDELAWLKDPERKERIDRMKRVLSREEGQVMEEQAGTEQNVARITDELRQLAEDPLLGYASQRQHIESILAIADRIDEQYYRTCRALDSAWSATSHEVLEQAIDELSDEWVKLPVDADGEIWTGNERVFEVDSGTRYDMRHLMYDGEKWIIDSSFGGFIANECRHVKPDSWERIIQDALTVGWQNGNWNEVASAEIHDRLVERCKKLAGE